MTFLLGLLLTSCQSIELLPIDYLIPAEISFPQELKRVAVVNNMPAVKTAIPQEVAESYQDISIVYKKQQIPGIAQLTTEALARQLSEGNYFEQVIICDSALRAHDKAPRKATLTPDEIQELTQGLEADFLIALENVQLSTSRRVEYSPYYQAFLGTTDLKAHPTIRIYLPQRNEPIATIQTSDSIFWETLGGSLEQAQSRLISQKELRAQASEFAGTLPVKKLLPHWETAYRYLFAGGSAAMRDAMVYVRENNWPEAANLWKQVYEQKKGKKKLQAAHNLAVALEMQDSIPQALEWAEKAKKIAFETDKVAQKKSQQGVEASDAPNYALISIYTAELQKRKSNLLLLNMQMERFKE